MQGFAARLNDGRVFILVTYCLEDARPLLEETGTATRDEVVSVFPYGANEYADMKRPCILEPV